MKKLFLFAMTAVAMLFTACSNDNSAVVDVNGDAGVQRIVLSVENSGSGMQTRAGRELLSSEAKQSIENVAAIIVNASTNKIVKVMPTITDWNTSAANYTDGGHGKKKDWILEGDERLNAATYKVYAFGYSNGTTYSDLATFLSGLTVGADYTGNPVLTTPNVYGEEIFAGEQSFTLAADKAQLNTSIILHRQVAGMFVYVDEIPYVAGERYLRLYASDNNKKVVLGDFAPAAGTELANNGSNTHNKVVNGTNGAGAQTKILEADLNDWFSSIADNSGLINAANWITAGHGAFNSGSVFVGNFIIPFEKTAANTLVLKLEDASSNVLRSWNIKLPDPLTASTTIRYWNSTAFADRASYTETGLIYSIFRNHLYGIGTKKTDINDPDPTNEDPQTLNTKEDILLKVNDNWEVIHTMEIE